VKKLTSSRDFLLGDGFSFEYPAAMSAISDYGSGTFRSFLMEST
jgi:hypothetical protein